MMRSRSKIIAVSAVFAAIGIILGYIETFIVIPVRVPGLRIGLSNIITVISLYLLGPAYAAAVLFIRVALSAVLFGSPVSFIYSCSGAASALIGMILMKKMGFSVYGVSVFGAAVHNTAQITVAMILVGSTYVIYYLPVLVIAAVATGLLIGYLSHVLIGKLGRFSINNESEGRT